MNLEAAIRASARGFGDALCDAWELIKREFADQDLYAVTVRTYNHFGGFACAVNTREHLRSVADSQSVSDLVDEQFSLDRLIRMHEVQCDEWVSITAGLDAFEDLNERVHELYGRDDYYLIHELDRRAVWQPILRDAFEQLKREAPVADAIESKLLGYQALGPVHLDWDLTIALAQSLGPTHWAEQLREARVTGYELGVRMSGKEEIGRILGPEKFEPVPDPEEPFCPNGLGGRWQLVFVSEEPAPFDRPLDAVLDDDNGFRASGEGVEMAGRYEIDGKAFTLTAEVTRDTGTGQGGTRDPGGHGREHGWTPTTWTTCSAWTPASTARSTSIRCAPCCSSCGTWASSTPQPIRAGPDDHRVHPLSLSYRARRHRSRLR